MKVFVTGATGFIGSAIVRELLAARHTVIGLARSEAAAAALAALGVDVQRGALDDLDSLRRGAAASDGVIHTAFIHDFANYGVAAEADRHAIETIGAALAGSNRPFVVTAGLAGLAPSRPATEDDEPDAARAMRFSESAALALVSRGVRVSVVRLPPSVHGEGDHGFVPGLIQIARARGVSAYPGDGANRWSAVHRLDAARLFRVALEDAPAGARIHGVADEGVAVRDIAGVIGRRLNLPNVGLTMAEANEHFGWLGAFFSMDIPATSTLTQQRLGWQPVEGNLLADLDHDYYFTPAP